MTELSKAEIAACASIFIDGIVAGLACPQSFYVAAERLVAAQQLVSSTTQASVAGVDLVKQDQATIIQMTKDNIKETLDLITEQLLYAIDHTKVVPLEDQ